MTRFEASNTSTAVVAAGRFQIWEVLTDPGLLSKLTPLVRRIEADGDTWVWHLTGIEGLGREVAPVFTEAMTFAPKDRIDYTHAPPPGTQERAGADGHYKLSDAAAGGTRLHIQITIHVDLPLPKLSGPAVELVMARSMTRTGEGFARNLQQHLARH